MFRISSTLAANLTTGVLSPSTIISARASLAITLSGYGDMAAANARAALYRLNRQGIDGTLVATCNTFTVSGSTLVGSMSLNTTELIAAYTILEGVRQYETLRFDLLVWDAADSVYQLWEALDVAYEHALSDDASNVSPISTGTTLWGNMKLIGGVIHLQSQTDGEWYPLTAAGEDATIHPVMGETGIP